MKLIKLIFILIFGSLIFTACGNDDDDPAEEKDYTKPKPEWIVSNPNQYPVSMTAIVSLPGDLTQDISDGDLLAAFINGECRGIANSVKVENTSLYYVLVKADSEENGKVQFKYYNTKKSYLYETEPFLNYDPEISYGTADNPQILNLSIVE